MTSPRHSSFFSRGFRLATSFRVFEALSLSLSLLILDSVLPSRICAFSSLHHANTISETACRQKKTHPICPWLNSASLNGQWRSAWRSLNLLGGFNWSAIYKYFPVVTCATLWMSCLFRNSCTWGRGFISRGWRARRRMLPASPSSIIPHLSLRSRANTSVETCTLSRRPQRTFSRIWNIKWTSERVKIKRLTLSALGRYNYT